MLLDCPISGTARRLKEGAWTMFISGDAKACKQVAPILAVFTRNAPYVGAFGNGSKMKFIANHLVAIYNVSVAESMTFARRMGLDAQQVWDLFAPSPIIGTGVYRRHGARGRLPGAAVLGVPADLQRRDGAGARAARHRLGVRGARPHGGRATGAEEKVMTRALPAAAPFNRTSRNQGDMA
jgi:3-hydroxyisobutyrate dehydrogenase-like beta-hydroxyacid dehydrogenase